MSAPCRLNPDSYIAPYYGPIVPCDAEECDPFNPNLWKQEINNQFNIQQSNQATNQNIQQGGWSTAYGWHGDLNARTYYYTFFDKQIKTPINFYWTNWPRTDYAAESCNFFGYAPSLQSKSK